jgi:hypothetical protein
MHTETLNPDCPLERKLVILAKAGIQMIAPRKSGQYHGFVSFAGVSSYWIPAVARMTELVDYLCWTMHD